MKITRRQLRRIIREAVASQHPNPRVNVQMDALYKPIPDDMDPDEAYMLSQYRDEWRKLQRKVMTMGADDPEAWNVAINQPPNPDDPHAWEHKSVHELEGPYELQRGVQARMDYLLDHMKDLWNEYGGA